jgi:HAD superfamily hydrolase (TIGR01509 family)
MPAIKAVLFDLDGTLLDTETLSDQAMLLALEPPASALENGAFPLDLKAKTLGLHWTAWAPLVLEYFAPLYPPSSPLTLTPTALATLWEEHLHKLVQTPACVPLPGALSLVQTLAAHSVPIAIATSSSLHAVAAKKVSNPALFSAFSAIVSGDQVQNGKPAPDIFVEAARLLSVPPSECMVFEDSVAGCQAGKAAGCFVVAVPDPCSSPENLALLASSSDLVLPSLLQFSGSRFNLPTPLNEALMPNWLNNTNVDRQSLGSLSTHDFIDKYERPGRPCILTGVIPTWPAATEWTRERMLERFGDTEFRVSATRDMKLSAYFEYCDAQASLPRSRRDPRPLYLFQKDFPSVAPPMASEYSIPPYFAEDLMSVLPPSSRPDYRWLIIGPALSGSSFHVDPNANFAWNATIQGRKKWIFYPPGCPPPKSEIDSRQVDLLQWFEEFYDNDPNENLRLECVTEAGECMYVPKGWWHCVLNIDMCIAITHNVVTGRNLLDAVEFLEDTTTCAAGVGCRGAVKFNLSGDVPTSVIYPYKDQVEEETSTVDAALPEGETTCECNKRTQELLRKFLAGMNEKHPGMIEEARENRLKSKKVIVAKKAKTDDDGGGFSFNFL